MDSSEDITRQLERRIRRHQVKDGDIQQVLYEDVVEVGENLDGELNTLEENVGQLLACGHVFRPGQRIVICQRCSRRAKAPVYVCERCSTRDPATGETLCPRCAAKRARRNRLLGLLGLGPSRAQTARRPVSSAPADAPSQQGPSWLRRLMEWW